jgi:hypothetical protein
MKHDGWAIEGPDGKWFGHDRPTWFKTKRGMIDYFVHYMSHHCETSWKTLYRKGYRCVKVRLVEVKEKEK